jgi:hypothetical protein
MTWLYATCWFLGAAAGVLHAIGIWRSAARLSVTTALLGFVRLVSIALVLTLSALLGGLILAALGWGVGFFATVAIIVGRGESGRPCRSRRVSS